MRYARIGGIGGPFAFLAAWSVLGARWSGYSPVHDPISRLAAVGSPDRWWMTGGMLAFAVGVGGFGVGMRRTAPLTAAAAVTSAVATLGVAATPLDSAVGRVPHAVAVAVAYAALAALPMTERRDGSVAYGSVVGAVLLASVLAPGAQGLLQRTGLTLGHAWIVRTAWADPPSGAVGRRARR